MTAGAPKLSAAWIEHMLGYGCAVRKVTISVELEEKHDGKPIIIDIGCSQGTLSAGIHN
jgi:hypothetical protein